MYYFTFCKSLGFHLGTSDSWKNSKQQQLENCKNYMYFKKAFNRQQRRQFGCCFVFQSAKEQASYLFLCLSILILTQTLTRFWHRMLYSYGLEQRKRPAGLQQLTTAFSWHWALTYLQKDTPPRENKTWLCYCALSW